MKPSNVHHGLCSPISPSPKCSDEYQLLGSTGHTIEDRTHDQYKKHAHDKRPYESLGQRSPAEPSPPAMQPWLSSSEADADFGKIRTTAVRALPPNDLANRARRARHFCAVCSPGTKILCAASYIETLFGATRLVNINGLLDVRHLDGRARRGNLHCHRILIFSYGGGRYQSSVVNCLLPRTSSSTKDTYAHGHHRLAENAPAVP